MPRLTLKAVDFHDPQHWRWTLTDHNGAYLGDHEVRLDSRSPNYLALLDLDDHLDRYCAPDRRLEDETRILNELGAWASPQLLGPLAAKIIAETPATVSVLIPASPAAESLLYLPWELAHANGRPLALHDVSLVFQVDGDAHRHDLRPVGHRLRVLAVFSLPEGQSALNLRRERYQLTRLFNGLAAQRGLAIDVRVLQYGVTRQMLQHVLEEGEGWDLIHFSGHGGAAVLILETAAGTPDPLPSPDLVALLKPARARLKWVTLSACSSAAATIQETLRWLGLDRPDEPRDNARPQLTALARALVRELDCAVLAMRFPVDDDFAIHLAEQIYGGVLAQGNSLDRALQIALHRIDNTPLSMVTPALFGARAADLALTAPSAPPERPTSIGMAYFDQKPSEHFVGRVATLAQASQALAPESEKTAVLFHGMAGGGKTACALELAFHYEKLDRFTDFVWFRAPDQGHEISGALLNFALQWELQVHDGNDQARLPFSHLLADPANFKGWLPRLKQFLRENSVLIVLDNLESLLLSDGRFRDDTWTHLLATLLDHHGLSRVIMTSRIEPALPNRDRQGADRPESRPLTLPIHALPLDESALLARQLPNLSTCLRDQTYRPLVFRTLRLVQGHPKLIEFAEALAADPAALSAHLDRAEQAQAGGSLPLQKFFESGESSLGVEQFLEVLAEWTASISQTVSTNARTLFHFLCCLEEADREEFVIDAVWPKLQNRDGEEADVRAGLLKELITSALVNENAAKKTIHPGVAEAGRAQAGAAFQAAVDQQAGEFWQAALHIALEGEEQGAMVVRAGLSGAPYLMRLGRWEPAVALLERVAHRDKAPSTLAAVLPVLHRIAEATEGTPRGLIDAGVLSGALSDAGRVEEAEAMMRETIRAAVLLEQFRTASAVSGELINIMRRTGRAAEALSLVDEAKGYTGRAGLGPWTQLSDEGRRLQILADLGQYQEVLRYVAELRKTMRDLSAKPAAKNDTVNPWNVREVILGAGRSAAQELKQWETALSLNREILESQQSRGAPPLELARSTFNSHRPLLELTRVSEARRLLDECRSVYERAGATPQLGRLFTALATLEDKLGNTEQSVHHTRTALRYLYIAGNPEDCAISHFNLANYLMRTSGPPETALAHRLAAVLITLQTSDGHFPQGIAALARDLARFAPSPPLPRGFDHLCEIVERTEGVDFRKLFDRLPKTNASTGDEALRIVLQKAESPDLSAGAS
jgi:tetratricopeptide (TPR) repeat protein